jgi:hypothetical protein
MSTSIAVSNEASSSDNAVITSAEADDVMPSAGSNTVTLSTYNVNPGGGIGTVTVRGSPSQVNLGNGDYVVNGGPGDSITLFGDGSKLALQGSNEMVFLSGMNSNIDDLSQGMRLVLGGSPGNVTLSDFAQDQTGVVDLRGDLGGFTTPQEVVSALTCDGHGGWLLSFGAAGSLDFVNTPASHLTASHFAIG